MHFSVTQGCIQGAFLFIAYASTITEVIQNSLQLNTYVDGHVTLRMTTKTYNFLTHGFGAQIQPEHGPLHNSQLDQ